MSDRLDRIERIVESNARTVSALTDRMATLLTAIDESNERFKVLRAEAQRDREEFRQSWNDAVAQMEKDRAEARKAREAIDKRAEADRAEAKAAREAMKAQAQADRATDKERFEAAQAASDEKFAANQEIIQRLLLEILELNKDGRRMGDRVARLEQRPEAS